MGRLTIILLLSFASLGISSGENVVAPTRAEIEAMYAAAAQEVNAGNYGEALKKLDEMDTRQPDVAVAKNLRGIALMRMGEFGLAEKALQKAKELDPNLWEARFNLAELPFVQKNWSEARDRFETLAKEPNEQRNDATADLIRFKIFLTWLLQHKEKQASELLQRIKASSASPAYYCAQAALAFQQEDATEARVNVRAAEKVFSSRQTALFFESFYEIGWMKRPDNSAPVALETRWEADRVADAQGHLKEAEQAYREANYHKSLQLLEQVDAVAPNQAVTYNLRGEVFLEQGNLEKAESSFRNALATDPQFEEARFNLAQIPWRKGDYESARKRLEELQGAGSGESGQARTRQQLIQYEIFLTLLLQNHEGAAQKAMEQFRMTDDTPALYYAQAAWAFQHQNERQAKNWMANAGNLFSPEQNRVFAAPLREIGWLDTALKVASTPTTAFVQASPPPAARPMPAATPEQSLSSAASEDERAPQSPLAATPAATKVRREEGKQKHRDEPEESSVRDGDHPKAMAKPKEGKKAHRKRSASKQASLKPSPAPSSTPAATPEPTQKPTLQKVGDTVLHVLLSPFRRRPMSEPSPAPAPSATPRTAP